MNTNLSMQEPAARGGLGRRVAWVAAGAAVAATLVMLNATPASDAPAAGMRLLDESAPAAPQQVVSRDATVNWDAVESAADPGPAAVAAYEE